jgi:hypothetical protein
MNKSDLNALYNSYSGEFYRCHNSNIEKYNRFMLKLLKTTNPEIGYTFVDNIIEKLSRYNILSLIYDEPYTYGLMRLEKKLFRIKYSKYVLKSLIEEGMIYGIEVEFNIIGNSIIVQFDVDRYQLLTQDNKLLYDNYKNKIVMITNEFILLENEFWSKLNLWKCDCIIDNIIHPFDISSHLINY